MDPDAPERTLVPWLAIALTVATIAIAWPFAPWILFALWASVLLRPAHAWLARKLGRRTRIAAVAVTLGLVLVVVPLIVVLATLADDAAALVRRALATDRVQSLLRGLATGDAVGQGGRAWALAREIAGTTARVALGLVIAIGGLYGLLADGGRWYAWLADHAPVSRTTFRRLAGAVVETGRGLVFGILGAGLAQALVATGFYVVLAVPHPLALGLLTLVCSIIPAIGTAIVWVPVAASLAVAGRDAAAIVLAAGGVLVIGTIDNFVRPYLARRGNLQLPTLVVALAMFGGLASMGPRGLVIGPLIVRLAKELLAVWASSRTRAS